ncbi:MAG: fatty acid desaturase [Pseudomonadota bacterium]
MLKNSARSIFGQNPAVSSDDISVSKGEDASLRLSKSGVEKGVALMLRRRGRLVEWPTLALLFACYAVWLGALLGLASVSAWLAVPILALAVTLHASLQHEAIHGHPTQSRRLNQLLVFPALGLFVPYGRFEAQHLAHHRDPNLTDPYDDPESWYLDPMVWAHRPGWLKRLLDLNNTLAGRVLLGPALSVIGMIVRDGQSVAAGDRAVARAWGGHAIALLPVLGVITLSPVPIWAYVIAAYVGFGIVSIRTFLEHQAHELARGRSVIIEDRGPLAFLFLNNNLHFVHHAHPGVAWYDLPALYRRNRERYLTRNLGYRFRSYGDVLRRFAFRRKEPVPHPLMPR